MNYEKGMINYPAFSFMSKYNICIPIIQREYIQGCNDQRIINTTKEMIDDILEALKNKRDKVNLNIIYGYSENEVFYPIDGQQRLTLLYLIIYYCAIMGDELEDFKSNIKSFSYETKDTSKRFFEVIKKKAEDIKKILNSGKDVIQEMKSCLWFQVGWNNDVTINSVLSILKKLNEEINKEDAIKYYQKIKDIENPCIVFDICIESKKGAKLNSSVSYISLNARGKMLEDFENVKSLLEKIEHTLKNEKSFSDQYDRKYIDVFYKSVDSSKKLEDKTKEINQKSIAFLLNSYNLVNSVFGDNTNRNYVDGFEDYYEKLYFFDKENNCIMNIYFDFIHKVLSELYDKAELIKEYPILKSIWDEKQVSFFISEKETCDLEYAVIFLLYLFFNSNVSIEALKKLEYVLENIGYATAKQINFDFAHYICEKIKEDDIYEYLIKVMNIDDVTKGIIWVNSGKDLKCRLKEQIIKFKVIDYYNKSFNGQKREFDYFRKIGVEKKENSFIQLYYLLYITNLWDQKITKESIVLLDTYLLSLNKNILLSSEHFIKKWFAIATYYDYEKDELESAQTINKKCNYVYIRYEGERKIELSNDNLHKLDSKIYTTNDNTEYENNLFNDKDLKQRKLYTIKKVYDFLLKLDTKEKRQEWLKSKFTKEYDNCWLKFAVYRKHAELLDNKLNFHNGKVYIRINNEMYSNAWVRFDTRVLLLDLKKEHDASEKYISSIWSYDTKHIDSYKNEIGLVYDEYGSNMKAINHFPVPVFNFLYRERYLQYEKSSESKRCFFYCMNKINLNFPEDIVYAIVGNKINLYQFDKEYEYTKFSYSLDDDIKWLKKEENDFENELKNLPKDCQAFKNSQDSWSISYYKYLGGIYKYGKKTIEKSVDIKLFEKNGEGSLKRV